MKESMNADICQNKIKAMPLSAVKLRGHSQAFIFWNLDSFKGKKFWAIICSQINYESRDSFWCSHFVVADNAQRCNCIFYTVTYPYVHYNNEFLYEPDVHFYSMFDRFWPFKTSKNWSSMSYDSFLTRLVKPPLMAFWISRL